MIRVRGWGRPQRRSSHLPLHNLCLESRGAGGGSGCYQAVEAGYGVLQELVPGHQVAHTHQETPIFILSHPQAKIQG